MRTFRGPAKVRKPRALGYVARVHACSTLSASMNYKLPCHVPCPATAQAPGGGPYCEAVGRLRQQMADAVGPQRSNGGGGGSGEVEGAAEACCCSRSWCWWVGLGRGLWGMGQGRAHHGQVALGGGVGSTE